MRRNRPADNTRPPKRPVVKRPSDQGPGIMQYAKIFALWACLLGFDQLFEQRVELLIPLQSLLRSILYINRTDGPLMTLLFIGVTTVVDLAVWWFVPIHWLYFIATVHIWVQMLWQADSDLYVATILLFVMFVYVEATIRLYTLPILDIYTCLAAHCSGSPIIMLALDVKELLRYQVRKRRRKEVEAENRFHLHLAEGSLPAPLRIQVNSYSDAQEDDQRTGVSSRPLSLAAAQDMEHGPNHSGVILWLLRAIYRYVSGWLDNRKNGGVTAGNGARGVSSAEGGPARNTEVSGSSVARVGSNTNAQGNSNFNETLGGAHGAQHDGASLTHRKRHAADGKESRSAAIAEQHTGSSTSRPASNRAYVEHLEGTAVMSLEPQPHSQAMSNGDVLHASGDHAMSTHYNSSGYGPVSGEEENTQSISKNSATTTDTKKSSGANQLPTQSLVATVAPVASAAAPQPPVSRKESKLQQDLSQVKSKLIATREREERLNDQVDDLKDTVRKLQLDLRESQQETKTSSHDHDTTKRTLRLANATISQLQKDDEAKSDQVVAARQAHDTAEKELRDLTRRVAADNNTIHQACRSTQDSLQREVQRQLHKIQHLEQQLTLEKSRNLMMVREMEKLKTDFVTLERKYSKESRERMDLVSRNRALLKQLDVKQSECVQLQQQVTEALAVMPVVDKEPPIAYKSSKSSAWGLTGMDSRWTTTSADLSPGMERKDGADADSAWPTELSTTLSQQQFRPKDQDQ